jgi:small-conductance mechanosensitive channel
MSEAADTGWLTQVAGVDPSTARVLWTVAILGGLALSWIVVRRLAGRASERYDGRRVETAEMVVLTALVGVTAAAIVLVWDAVTEIRDELQRFEADPRIGVLIVLSLLIAAVAYGVVRIASRIVRPPEEDDVPTDHRREVAYHVVQVSVYAVAGVVVLTIWGIRLGNLLVGAGFLGIVLGLAARQTLGAVLAGFVLLFSRPFTVGDWVVIDDEEGVVTDVSVVNTQLRTLDDEYVMIPNDQVTGEAIVNRSRGDKLRVTVEVGVDYDADPDHAADVAAAAMEECDETLDGPSPYVVGKRFGDSSVVLELRFWIDDPSARRMWRARTEVVGAVKAAFDDEGIDIPFPQRTLGGRESGGIRLGSGAEDGRPGDGDGRQSGADGGSSENGEAATADGEPPERADGSTEESSDGSGANGAEDVEATPEAADGEGDA